MARVNSAVELKDWVLRSLGAPIIQVEVTEDQIYDCIDEAIDLFTEFHHDGATKNVITCVVSEEMAAQRSVYLDDRVFAVNRVIHSPLAAVETSASFTDSFTTMFVGGMPSYSGHRAFSGMFSQLNGFSMTTYVLWRQFEKEWTTMFQPAFNFSFNSITKELKLLDNAPVGSILAFEVYTPIGVKLASSVGESGGSTYNSEHQDNPLKPQFIGGEMDDDNPHFDQRIFDNRWVKEYTRALVKRVHGTIMKKYNGVNLPGGASVDGSSIYSEAISEMRDLREELEMLDEPMPIIMG